MLLLPLVVLVGGCAGTEEGDDLRDGCVYLIEFQELVEQGLAVIPSEQVEFWGTFSYRNLAHLCDQIRRIDERQAELSEDEDEDEGHESEI